MGAACDDALSRLRGIRAAAALAGLGHPGDAQCARGLRAEMVARANAGDGGAAVSALLARARRGQEAGLRGSVPLQRRSGLHYRTAAEAAVAGLCGLALRPRRSP